MNHKPELDRLYADCDRSFGDDWHKAFDKLSEYVESHNLTLAQIAEIRHPDDSTELTRADFALCDLLPE